MLRLRAKYRPPAKRQMLRSAIRGFGKLQASIPSGGVGLVLHRILLSDVVQNLSRRTSGWTEVLRGGRVVRLFEVDPVSGDYRLVESESFTLTTCCLACLKAAFPGGGGSHFLVRSTM
jgi:hypothetical protein